MRTDRLTAELGPIRGLEEARRHLALLEEILNEVHVSVIVLDLEDRFLAYNREAENCEGLKAEEVLGRSAREVYEDFYYEAALGRVKKTGRPLLNQRHTGLNNEGRQIDLLYDVYPYLLEGRPAAVYIIGRGLDLIAHWIANTLEQQRRVLSGQDEHGGNTVFLDDLVGRSPGFRDCLAQARKMGARDAAVMIVGETGTGKDLLAQGLHNASFFADGPFVPVNCAAIPESLLEGILFGTVRGAFTGAANLPGLFEQAGEGTLFLDEINSMPLVLQAKLLRVLQERRVRRVGSQAEIQIKCRILSATNKDPVLDLRHKKMRPDLFFRLANMVLTLPPLRERPEDIPCLAQHFIEKYNREFGLRVKKAQPALLEKFRQYFWPGNIRELANMIENAMTMISPEEEAIGLDHLPEYTQKRLLQFPAPEIHESPAAPEGLQAQLAAFEKCQIAQALKRHKGSVTKAARALGLGRQNLHHKMNKYALNQVNGPEQP